MQRYRPTWVEISREAFASNVRTLKSFVGKHVKLLAVLKADAYGHGAAALAPVAIQNGASLVGVSSLEEGIELREAGFSGSLFLLGGIYPLQNFSVALQHDIIPTVASLEAVEQLARSDKKKAGPASFHLKVDTGMGRIGVSVEAAKKILEKINVLPQLHLAGVFSHFSSADSDAVFTAQQLSLFQEIKKTVTALGFKNCDFHIGNSAGTFLFPSAHLDMVRLGLSLYGASPVAWPMGLKINPVLSWRTKAIFLKKVPAGTPISYGRTFVTKKVSEIMTVPVGYADGVPRAVSNKAFVLVKGQRCPVVGRVTMDHLMVDVTGRNVTVGDDVVLIGKQEGESISVHDWAGWAGEIPYEIFCGLSKRVPRVVVA
jgi:alanine racemase